MYVCKKKIKFILHNPGNWAEALSHLIDKDTEALILTSQAHT